MKFLTRNEIARVDKKATRIVGLLQLMENAGNALATHARSMLKDVQGKKITILIGKGHNGGDGLAAARRLTDWGASVTLISAVRPGEFFTAASYQYGILKKQGLTISKKFPQQHDLIIDCLLGYNIKGNPREKYAEIINAANQDKTKVLSCDNPSGLDVTTGKAFDPCIKATHTLALAIPKIGLKAPEAAKVYVADIGFPHNIYKKARLNVPFIYNKSSELLVKR